jgi:DNA primase
MPRYTDDSRERVRERIDFAELVGARTELRQAGPRRMTGLCPFHEERTPSFGIDPVEKLYHCFGCGAGGDVFTFVMETEGLDFARALEVLAERAGVELERDAAEDPRDAERRQRRERLLALLERTAAFYVRLLWESGEAAAARAYLAERGLEEGALREYRVGWAPGAWDRVLSASRRAGFAEAELHAAGLIVRRRDGPGGYDRFRGRIMFPLADERGRVRGFGARAVRAEDTPKYLNTAEGELFHKGRILYGADLARAAAAKAGRVVLVEGYTDVIALRQAGIPETVCSMGTALTDQQVDALKRLAPRVLLCQDPDAAGQEAVAKGTDAIRAFNAARAGDRLEVRVVRLPGRDPADVVREQGAAAMHALLDGSVPVARFEVERAFEANDLETPEGRDRALAAAAPTIGRLSPGLLQDDLIRLAADRLQMSESVTHEALRRAAGRGGSVSRRGAVDGTRGADRAARPTRMVTSVDLREDTERAFLARCLAVKEAGRAALESMDVDEAFGNDLTRRAARYLVEHLEHPGQSLPAGADDLARLVAELVIRAGDLAADSAALALERLALDKLRLDRRIAAARRTGEPVTALAVERQRVQDEIRHRLV